MCWPMLQSMFFQVTPTCKDMTPLVWNDLPPTGIYQWAWHKSKLRLNFSDSDFNNSKPELEIFYVLHTLRALIGLVFTLTSRFEPNTGTQTVATRHTASAMDWKSSKSASYLRWTFTNSVLCWYIFLLFSRFPLRLNFYFHGGYECLCVFSFRQSEPGSVFLNEISSSSSFCCCYSFTIAAIILHGSFPIFFCSWSIPSSAYLQ